MLKRAAVTKLRGFTSRLKFYFYLSLVIPIIAVFMVSLVYR